MVPGCSAAHRRIANRGNLRFAVICLFGAMCANNSADGRLGSVHVQNNHPVVSFEVVEPGPDGRLKIEKRTHFSSFLDGNDVPAIHIGGGVAKHIANISAQANGIDFSDLDLTEALKREQSLTRLETNALDWLKENQVKIEDDAVVWHYTFDHTFNNIIIKSGWPSAFAQADAIKAFILAYRKSFDKSYLEVATHAGLAFTVPCERGGIRCEVGGIPWFEEIPVPYGYAPMILNGHLYSVVMLHHLYQLTGDHRVDRAFEEGVASAKRMLLRFDTGYWSIYQLRPRALDVKLALESKVPDTEIHEVSLSSAPGEPSVLRLGVRETSTFFGNQMWGAGWKDTSAWGRTLSGIGVVKLQPERGTIDLDPVNVGAMNIALRYRSPGCVPPTVATFDYRASSEGFVEIFPMDYRDTEDECVAHFALPNTINQWSLIDGFYHDWHTKLVAELSRITKDPEFYTTAIRWGRYATAEQKLKTEVTVDTISVPIFGPTDRADEDANIMQALGAADPATLSDDDVADKLRHWLATNCIAPEKAAKLASRAGLNPDKVKPPAC